MPDGAGDGAKSGGGFAFTVAGKDDHDAALFLRGGDASVNFIFTRCWRSRWRSSLIVRFLVCGRLGVKGHSVLRRLSSPISHR